MDWLVGADVSQCCFHRHRSKYLEKGSIVRGDLLTLLASSFYPQVLKSFTMWLESALLCSLLSDGCLNQM
ncbi:CTL-like protein [Gossypium australe]|uniref:CTL-like protein n=1 Tax=Gossypium australe TaxID=47621 RepID=A0A5B6X5R0_9ROSI|nr:CTL-like protein [Gossypium australe]